MRVIALICVAATGCLGTTEVPLPEIPEDAQTRLIITVPPAGVERGTAWASSLEGPSSWAFGMNPNEPNDVHVLTYSCSLEQLGLKPGSIGLLSGGGRELPRTPNKIVKNSNDAFDKSTKWEEADFEELAGSVRLNLPEANPCPTYELVPPASQPAYEMTGTSTSYGSYPVILPYPEEKRVLMSPVNDLPGKRNLFYNVTYETLKAAVDGTPLPEIHLGYTSTVGPAGAFIGGHLDANGKYWFFEREPTHKRTATTVWSGDDLQSLAVVTTCYGISNPPPERAIFLGPPDDLFVYLTLGVLHRIDGGTCDEWSSSTRPEVSDAVWLGRGHVLMVWHAQYLEYKDSNLHHVERKDIALTSVARTPFGIFITSAGAERGELLAWEGSIPIPHESFGPMWVVEGTDNGYVWADQHEVAAYIPGVEDRYCRVTEVSGGVIQLREQVRDVVPLGNDFLVVLRELEPGSPIKLRYVREAARPRVCSNT